MKLFTTDNKNIIKIFTEEVFLCFVS